MTLFAAALCAVRLINQAAAPPLVHVSYAGGLAAANVTFDAVSPYSPAPCTSTFSLVDAASGDVLASVDAAGFADGARLSLFASGDASRAPLRLSVTLDADSLLGDGDGMIDMAQVRACAAIEGPALIAVLAVASECFECRLPKLLDVSSGQCSEYVMVDATFPMAFGFAEVSGAEASSTPATFVLLEHGSYTLLIRNTAWSADARDVLALVADVEGQNAYLPLLWAALALVALATLQRLLTMACVRYIAVGAPAEPSEGARGVTLLSFFAVDAELAIYIAEQRTKEGGDDAGKVLSLNEAGPVALFERFLVTDATMAPVADVPTTRPRSAGRIVSIDTARGICLAIMIFVNYGGGSYSAIFDHSRWNGLSVADLVFPIFIFTSGVSLAISFASERRKGASAAQLALKVCARSAKLFLLGAFINNFSSLAEARVLGVLQYFAVALFVVGLLEIFLHPLAPGNEEDEALPETLLGALAIDVGRYWVQWAVMLTVGAIYLLVQSFLPLPPGCPTGYIGPGGLADHGKYAGLGCTGGAHRVVDIALFGLHHIYHGVDDNGVPQSAATCSEPYQCDVFDPEGVLGMLSAAFMCFLGLQAGRVFTHFRHLAQGPAGVKSTSPVFLGRWLTWALVLCLLGGSLCGFQKEGGLVPLNKSLWSPSFVLLLAGFANILLAVCYVVVDVLHFWDGAPFLFVGSNSIAIYALHELLDGRAPFAIAVHSSPQSHAEALASNLCGVVACLCVARFLYLKGWFVVI